MTTVPVLVESVHLLYNRVGVDMTLAWFETMQRQGVRVISRLFRISCGKIIFLFQCVNIESLKGNRANDQRALGAKPLFLRPYRA